MKRIAYLFPAFPVLHQTFTVGEVLGLKLRGYDLLLISLKPARRDLQQNEAVPLIAETVYCPPLYSWRLVCACWRALRHRPLDFLKLFAYVGKAWRSAGRTICPEEKVGATTFGFKERIEVRYQSNPYLYLLKSWLLIPYGLYVAELLKGEGIVHVHAHWATYPTTVAFLVKAWAGITYSFTAHAYDLYMINRMLPAKVEEALFVVTCAETNRRYLATLCSNGSSERIHVNYHGTDLSRFIPMEHHRGNIFRVVSCGWLKEYKGFHFLLDALALLRDRGIEVTLDLAGDGPQRRHLQERCVRLGIRDRVVFHGYVDHDHLRGLYLEADAFALPSIVMGRYGRQDVIPNVLAEAMAVGLPVVGSDIAGIPELIDHGVDGLLVAERDAPALADALELLWRQPETAARLGRAGREKVERIWDRDRNLDQLVELFKNTIPGRLREPWVGEAR